VTPTNAQYLVDRWFAGLTQASKYSVQQNAGSVTPPAGFTNYLGVTSLSAYSIVTSDIFFINQRIEGLNCADFAWGTANATTVTLSFWVRSSLTGTFGGALGNQAGSRSYPFTYTISSANTWEQKSVTILGDTTGTWLTTNDTGINVHFGLGVGSTFSGTAGAWAGSNFSSATGATSVVGTDGATFYITGVQLEAGSTATDFERRPIGTELDLCQRYFQGTRFYLGTTRAINGSGVLSTQTVPLSPIMRSAPSITITNQAGGINGAADGTQYSHTVVFVGATTANMGTVVQFDYTTSAEL
jgi:hypothetical protein